MLPSRSFGRFLKRAASHRGGEKRVLVAGLGNYSLRGTRHSVGMAVLGHLAHRLGVANQWETNPQCHADLAFARLGDVELVLMRPRRFMNVNGLSVIAAVELYNLGVENVYLVHDDLDKPLGKVALKLGGSARGHNGVRSCISSLHSDRMVRLRVGIGRPAGEISVDHYVLSQFSITEQSLLPLVYEKAVDTLLGHIRRTHQSQADSTSAKKAAKAPLKTEET
ncbi:peptidyl-tRNA hydrolase [Anolis sagrei]|uniref:peptidyl-tRNA hydrolase n=1 Tax=Anolis sagrei TaxID=38937 RepID=UPI0035218314